MLLHGAGRLVNFHASAVHHCHPEGIVTPVGHPLKRGQQYGERFVCAYVADNATHNVSSTSSSN